MMTPTINCLMTDETEKEKRSVEENARRKKVVSA